MAPAMRQAIISLYIYIYTSLGLNELRYTDGLKFVVVILWVLMIYLPILFKHKFPSDSEVTLKEMGNTDQHQTTTNVEYREPSTSFLERYVHATTRCLIIKSNSVIR